MEKKECFEKAAVLGLEYDSMMAVVVVELLFLVLVKPVPQAPRYFVLAG